MECNPYKGFTDQTLVRSPNAVRDYPIRVAEFAKRVFVNGDEVTPVSPLLIEEALEFPDGLSELLRELERRGCLYNYRLKVYELARMAFKPHLSLSVASFPLWPAPLFREGDVPPEEGSEGIIHKVIPWRIFPKGHLYNTTQDQTLSTLQECVMESFNRYSSLLEHLSDETKPTDPVHKVRSKAHESLLREILEIQITKIKELIKDLPSNPAEYALVSDDPFAKTTITTLLSLYDIEIMMGIDKGVYLTRQSRLNRLLKQISIRVYEMVKLTLDSQEPWTNPYLESEALTGFVDSNQHQQEELDINH
jgi:hypothetical protein